MLILGLNVYHGDSSACLLKDGKVICAFEEERFTRQKHWAGFPKHSIQACLDTLSISIESLDYITISRDPKQNLGKKIKFLFKNIIYITNFYNRAKNSSLINNLSNDFEKNFGVDKFIVEKKIKYVEHHFSHLASAFFASPFEKSAILSIDGFGDFTSTALAIGEGNRITKLFEVNFPHSIGQFYTAFTQYLGFHNYGDEYKVMGLAPYGLPKYLKEMEQILSVCNLNDNLFKLNLKYFTHHIKGVQTKIEKSNDPTPSLTFSHEIEKLFGLSRKPGDEITQDHKDIAASIQRHCENVIFHILNILYKETKLDNLCIAGGVAQNSVANGKLSRNTPFKNIYIPPAGHDAGTSIGSALYYYNQILGMNRVSAMFDPYLGSFTSNAEIEVLLKSRDIKFEFLENEERNRKVAKFLSDGLVVGWFQGKAEFGPRALGGRSILVDPRRKDAKDLLNAKIKRRESFRPFAPSILKENVKDFFEIIDVVPFMEKVFPIKQEKQSLIPAVTHVDGTGRLQSVDREISKNYHELISEFNKLTGIPILLNTSFNENEPIVNLPEQALDCFLRTNMDVLVLENYIVTRN
jgi:carbamoyltransferase